MGVILLLYFCIFVFCMIDFYLAEYENNKLVWNTVVIPLCS